MFYFTPEHKYNVAQRSTLCNIYLFFAAKHLLFALKYGTMFQPHDVGAQTPLQQYGCPKLSET